MIKKANPGRDAFRFSLRGMTTICPVGPVPAIADDHINTAIDARLADEMENQPTTTLRAVEDFLVRVFVPGANKAA